MGVPQISVVGKRGSWVIPARFRKETGIEEGTLVIAELTDAGILIRPAQAVPVERYSDERKAAFLLSSAGDAAEYQRARKVVMEMGLDPDRVPHERPEPPRDPRVA